jgi:long-chain acyl-CoA synthetase
MQLCLKAPILPRLTAQESIKSMNVSGSNYWCWYTPISDVAAPATYDIDDVLSAKKFPIPSPTIYFIRPAHLHALTTAILKHAQKSLLLHPLAWRHKLSGIRDGFVTKDSLWDRLLFDAARAEVVGEGAGTIRCVVVSGGESIVAFSHSILPDLPTSAPLDRSYLEPARIALSVPIVNAHIHPLVSAPVFASHPYDLQDFPANSNSFAHLACVGPPSINIEAKLVGVEDEVVEGGSDPVGILLVRGPSVGKEVHGAQGDVVDEGDWVGTGERAKVYANGSFKILA